MHEGPRKPIGGCGDRAYQGALIALGERRERVGEHDRYEPTVVSRVYFLLDREACQIKIGYTEDSVAVRQRRLRT